MDQFRQEDIDELFTDLKVIGSIKQHERINTSGPQIRIDVQGILQSVRRTWLGEGRESNLRGIKRAMTAANAFIDLAMAPPRTPQKIGFLTRMQRELDNTIRGLRNLQTTYDGDVTTQSRLDVHIENVCNKYEAIKMYIPIHEEEDGAQGGGAAASKPVPIPEAANGGEGESEESMFHTPVQDSEIEHAPMSKKKRGGKK